jgi:hypothetical protein
MQEIKQASSKQEINLNLGNRTSRKSVFSVELNVERGSKDIQENQEKLDTLNKKLEESGENNSSGIQTDN